jgi:tRNA(Ile)-lysidine synthase
VSGLTDFPDAEAALDRRLDLQSSAPVALALSGGGDSMALLHVAQAWARRRGRRLLALTVDHGLHADSAAWTAFAGAAARTVGADWRALHWRGLKPATGLSAAARNARHRLLANAAREAGASAVLLAHTADDIAEGDLMRREAAPTLGHLREWAPSPVWPEGRDVFILRPLLGVRRAALRAWLTAHGLGWLDDPANDDPRFARARARMTLAEWEPEASPPPGPWDSIGLARLAERVEHQADGRLTIDRSALIGLDPPQARRFLAIAAICASGQASPPRSDGLERLLRRVAADAPFVATLAGARIEGKAGALTFAREAGEMTRSGLAPLSIPAGETAVWDGRFEITADADIVVAPLAGSARRLSATDRARASASPSSARLAFPAVFQGEEVQSPRPFGDGPASARPLGGRRFDAACGLMTHERDISPPEARWAIAQGGRSSYVEALALA